MERATCMTRSSLLPLLRIRYIHQTFPYFHSPSVTNRLLQEGESEIHFVTIPLAYHSDIFGAYKSKLEAEQCKTVKSVMGKG